MPKIILELDDNAIRVIGEALGNAPFKVAAPIIAEIQKQINEQQQVEQPKTTNGKDEAQAQA